MSPGKEKRVLFDLSFSVSIVRNYATREITVCHGIRPPVVERTRGVLIGCNLPSKGAWIATVGSPYVFWVLILTDRLTIRLGGNA